MRCSYIEDVKTPKTIQFLTKVGVLPYFEGMHYLEIPIKIVKHFGGKFRVRLLCTISPKIQFHCGLMALGGGKGYLMLNKKVLKAAGLKNGSKLKIKLALDKSEFGMPMSEELLELLSQDTEGHERFLKLTPGKQRNIIHYVNSVKNSDKRIDRAITLIENLKRAEPGKETFRAILGLPPAEK